MRTYQKPIMFPFLEDSTLVRGRNTKCPRAISRSHCDKLIPSFRTTTRKLHSPQPRLFSMLTIEVMLNMRYQLLLCFATERVKEDRILLPVAQRKTLRKMILRVSLCNTRSIMTYGLATRVKSDQITSLCRSFDPCGNGLTLWQHLAETGNLPGEADLPYPARLGVGVCVKGVVPPKSTRSDWAEFSLAWDMPKVKLGDGRREYKRRYTRFFDSLEGLAAKFEDQRVRGTVFETFIFARMVQSRAFQRALLHDRRWLSVVREPHLSPYTQALMKRHGRFGYLESWEYRMVTTYDVHFYASYAIASLWPDLEFFGPFKRNSLIKARVPHDLGNPAQDPWLLTNAYVMHDTGKWKDLNLKFVLTSWHHVYPVVKLLINDALDCWDQDRDGMIENFGKADQTHDAWQMEGVSAYCGSLWLGALRVAVAMAEECGDIESSIRYHQTLVKAKQVFIDKLWNGAYFNFCERSKSRDSVMADQLCGIWFLQSCSPEMAAELVPTEKVSKALATIYELNVCKFGDGKMGAVNGMRPDGTLDRAYIQADEMWTGVTYAAAAFMIQQGELQRGFDTAFGSYDSCFERFELQFQTPEAIYEKKFYCAIGYMRPLSIWAMQCALERFYKFGKIDKHSSIQGLQPTTPAIPSPCPSANDRSLVDSQSEGYCSEKRDESNQMEGISRRTIEIFDISTRRNVIAEMGNNDKSRIILTMSAAVALALEKIEILKAFSDETPDKEVEKDVEQKSEKLNYETRRYYLDLKQNVSCELRKPKRAISYNVCMSRSQMVIPGEEAKRFRGEGGKMFYSLDLLLQNSEASFRTSITVRFIRWRNSEGLSKIIDGFEKVDGTAE
ncbi:unnamed protein product, partial [Mesorhabditis belari]|uniref:Non-lysosomal glucosylceramidase n=1 Tax=Mesorhabditis belari TaxID=2138241 RepID=A0AAF3J822_9BILA